MSDLVMLAHEYKEDKHLKKVDGYWISEKYDGVCGLFKQKDKTMWSRNGNAYTLPDFITEQLVSIGVDMHGEIWFGRDTFDICSGMARRDDNDDEAWKTMTFMVFDSPDVEGKNQIGKLPFEDRIRKFQKAWSAAGKPKNVKGVKFRKFHPEKTTVAEELAKVEEAGGEGLVLRKPGSKYAIKRSQDMLKVKSWHFDEAVVIGYKEGSGKYKGMVGALRVKNEQFGEFPVGTGLNDWQRGGTIDGSMDDAERKEERSQQNHSNNETYKKLVAKTKKTGKERRDALRELNGLFTVMPVIGDTITYRYKEVTKSGVPKFPSFVGVRDYE